MNIPDELPSFALNFVCALFKQIMSRKVLHRQWASCVDSELHNVLHIYHHSHDSFIPELGYMKERHWYQML